MSGQLAIALHDVEPRSFARTREIREWLAARGIDRVTLLVIPAAERHPLGCRAPALTAWLRGRTANGDVVAQHGLLHRAGARPDWPQRLLRTWQGGIAAEFPGLSEDDTARRVRIGLRLLSEVELDPRGFVAPGYAYTPALRKVLAESFEWFADIRAVQGRSGMVIRSPALCLGSSTRCKRWLSPAFVRVLGLPPRQLMRVDIHPADFDRAGHVAALETLLHRGRGREPITYDELFG